MNPKTSSKSDLDKAKRRDDVRSWAIVTAISVACIVVGLAGARAAAHSRPMRYHDIKMEWQGIKNKLYDKALDQEINGGDMHPALIQEWRDLEVEVKAARNRRDTARRQEASDAERKALHQAYMKVLGAQLSLEKEMMNDVLAREDLETYNETAYRYKVANEKYNALRHDPAFANSGWAWFLAWLAGFLCGIVLWGGIAGLFLGGVMYGLILLIDM